MGLQSDTQGSLLSPGHQREAAGALAARRARATFSGPGGSGMQASGLPQTPAGPLPSTKLPVLQSLLSLCHI